MSQPNRHVSILNLVISLGKNSFQCSIFMIFCGEKRNLTSTSVVAFIASYSRQRQRREARADTRTAFRLRQLPQS